jgi:hypothetical protein
MEIFYCISPTGKVNNKSWAYIEAERWFDARKVAYTLFGTDQVKFELVHDRPGEEQHQGNFYTAKWEGSPMDPQRQPELKVTAWPKIEKVDSESASTTSGSSSFSSPSPSLSELPSDSVPVVRKRSRRRSTEPSKEE